MSRRRKIVKTYREEMRAEWRDEWEELNDILWV